MNKRVSPNVTRRAYHTWSLILSISLAIGVCAGAPGAAAADYPTKPIRVIVAFPPGGPVDSLARMVGQNLSERWGQPVIVENKPGAGGSIGANFVAKSPADGYTLLFAPVGHAMNASVYSKLPFDTLRDFTPVVNVAASPFVLVVHPSVAAKSIPELITLAKASPRKLTYASAGIGSANHLAGALFRTLAGIDIVHVAYKGSAPSTNDLLGGHVTMIFNNMVNSMPYVKGGQLRAIAVTGAARSSVLPDVPTIAESGVPGFDVTGWYGLFGPAGLPADIVQKLNSEINWVAQIPDVQQRLRGQGLDPVGGSAESFAVFVKAEVEKWAKVVKASGAQAD